MRALPCPAHGTRSPAQILDYGPRDAQSGGIASIFTLVGTAPESGVATLAVFPSRRKLENKPP